MHQPLHSIQLCVLGHFARDYQYVGLVSNGIVSYC